MNTKQPYLEALLCNTSSKISFVDSSYTYLAISKEYERTFSLDESQIVGKKIWEITGMDTFKTFKPYLDRALNGECLSYEKWFDFPEDKRLYLSVSYSPVKENNKILGVVVTANDMTKMKLLEIEYEKQYTILLEKLKSAKLGNMISFLTHQIRQPINTIATSLMKMNSLLKKKALDELNDLIDQNEHIVVHLSDTLDSISEYNNLNGGISNVNIKLLIDNALLLLEHNIFKYNIDVSVVCRPDQTINTIKSDFIHILLIVINNSVEELIKSKKKIKKIKIKVQSQENKLIIKVYDTGKGVDKKVLEKLFKPGSTTKTEAGHGYGLYFAKDILENRLNGSIEYISSDKEKYFQICLNQYS
jgi:PAS domain S-box-containing protein